MCGIVGLASSGSLSDADHEWLWDSVRRLKHRGPDSEGEFVSRDNRVILGHRRLAVIDTSQSAAQPMIDASGVAIVLNGEIYNFQELRATLVGLGHEFRSHGDTEVVLRGFLEWDVTVLERLLGAYSFGVYDPRDGRLILARDRAGEKPLYYSFAGGKLIFASEAKAIVNRPGFVRRVDLAALDSYLHVGYGRLDRSLFHGVAKVPPGHSLVWNLRDTEVSVSPYWSLPSLGVSAGDIGEASLVERLDALLERAVSSQLVADVPVGVLLSGGVDSSLITAYAAEARSSISTFTIRFPQYADLDETAHARQIAAFFGTSHTELDASDVNPDLVRHLGSILDDPIADSSLIPTFLVSELVRAHCTVALGGDGGDELFGGYNHYSRLVTLQRRTGWIPRTARRAAAYGALRVLPEGFKGRNWAGALGHDYGGPTPALGVMFGARARHRLVPELAGVAPRAEEARSRILEVGRDIVDTACRLDFATYLPEDILVKVDRASMMNSLEIRAPFLDRALIEFAFGSVPSPLKATAAGRKLLLKQVARVKLPDSFDLNRKQGFSIPLGTWLRHSAPWREFFRDVLLGSPSSFLNRNSVTSLLEGHDRGLRNSERLFSLVMLELWRQQFDVTV